MPETTVVTPAAVVPADRLTLGATDARSHLGTTHTLPYCSSCSVLHACMAEE